MKIFKFVILITLITLLFSACQVEPPVPPTATKLPTKPQIATEAPKPTSTVAPSATATKLPPTVTPTVAPSATAVPSLTPTQAFAGFRILYSDYQKWGLMIVFSIPGIKQSYDLKVNNVLYSCSMYPNLPDQLLCIGPEFPHNRKVELAFYTPKTTSTPVFSTDYVIAPIKTPTPIGYIPTGDASCPVRGIGVSCETENRPDTWPGGPCIVSTCVDICGYWYSIDTCK